jgi:hypothetical protein
MKQEWKSFQGKQAENEHFKNGTYLCYIKTNYVPRSEHCCYNVPTVRTFNFQFSVSLYFIDHAFNCIPH